jgi:hypothetical protein
MENRAGSDEANSRDNLRCNASVISNMLDGEFVRKQCVHSRAEANEEISAQAGWAVLKLALQSDQAAENCRQYEADEGNPNHRRHLVLKDGVDISQCKHVVGWILSLQSPHQRVDRE